MIDDKSNPWHAGYAEINVADFDDVRYWAVKLGVDQERIRDAVAKVGPIVEDVMAEVARGRY